MPRKIVGALLAALILTLPAPVSEARENRALLIGAASYANLDQSLWLVGPTNDIDLARQYLTDNPHVRFPPHNIVVLGEAAGATGPATLDNIRKEMARLAETAQPGDFIYLHFSGHGSQMPSADPATEPDGLDEIFLPADVGPWNDDARAVANALVDDEIGAMIDRIRARGANVWAVFDSCHSGTVTRAAPSGDDDLRLRRLEPADLGVPVAALDRPAMRGLTDPRAPAESPFDATATNSGALVAFFAAQTTETTPEKRLPRGQPGRRAYGVFTYTLFETLAANPGATYRQIGQEILRRYAADRLAGATPLFEGDLDAPVFGDASAERVQQWPLRIAEDGASATIAAGSLHGLTPGDRLAVVARATDPETEALGLVQVASADVFSARLVPVAGEGATLTLADLPRRALVRKLGATLGFGLRVALPRPGSDGAAALISAAPLLRQALPDNARITFVAPGDPADLRLALAPGRHGDTSEAVLFLPETGLEGPGDGAAPRIELHGKSLDEVVRIAADTLIRMARVQNLLRLGNALNGAGLSVDLALQTRSADAPDLHPLQTLPVPRLIAGDEIHLVASNDEQVPLDLNVLYIGSDYSITHIYAGRLQPGDTLRQGLLGITDTSLGRERLVMILTPAGQHDAVEDLSFLEQDEMPMVRGSGPTAFDALLREAAFGVATRGAVRLGGVEDDGPRPMLVQFDIDAVAGN